jgi:hypothetical protein
MEYTLLDADLPDPPIPRDAWAKFIEESNRKAEQLNAELEALSKWLGKNLG